MKALLLVLIFTIEPVTLLTGQDSAVFFSVPVACAPNDCPENIELTQWNAKKTEVKARWQLYDNGLWGDQKAGDHIYSRRIQFKEKKPKRLYFTTSLDDKTTLTIRSRPTFVQLLSGVWNKIRHHLGLGKAAL